MTARPAHATDTAPGRLLTAEEVAERWAVPRAHVYRMAREGLLPTVQLGRYKRWRVDALEDFERRGGSTPTSEREAS